MVGQHRSITLAAALAFLAPLAMDAGAAEVSLVGLFPGKALVSIDGGPPRTLSVGSSVAGVKLLTAAHDDATFEIDGKTQRLSLGQLYGGASNSGRKSTTLSADGRGHFVTQGMVNGGVLTFLVDTGASLVTMAASDASRLGIDWRSGIRSAAGTANGPVTFYRVRIASLKIGEIVVNNVEAGVQESGLPAGIALLGMSFLSRTEIQQTGPSMVLTQRY